MKGVEGGGREEKGKSAKNRIETAWARQDPGGRWGGGHKTKVGGRESSM